MKTKLILKESIPFLEPGILRDFCDLRILSNDGHHFLLNKCVFVASCKGFTDQILGQDGNDLLAISTDLSKEDLGLVVNFCVSGRVPSLNLLREGNVLSAFQQFGIDLTGLELVKEDISKGVKNGNMTY